MSTQRLAQLFVSFGIITTIALVSEKSRTLASIISVAPVNVTIALWFISTSTNSDSVLSADFLRMVLFGLIPTGLFILVGWLGFRQGWSFSRVLLVGYTVWLSAMGIYRGIEWWLKTR